MELVVTTFNVNAGHNTELMSQCRILREYSIYVAKVRSFKEQMPVDAAVQKAVSFFWGKEKQLYSFIKSAQEFVPVHFYQFYLCAKTVVGIHFFAIFAAIGFFFFICEQENLV